MVKKKTKGTKRKTARLLAGGNPQIAKAEGEKAVKKYIAAIPGWKKKVVERINGSITMAVPETKYAVKWNSPFYGIEDQGWYATIHVFTKYVKITFFNGVSLNPHPPGFTDRSKNARWLDIYENDNIDSVMMASWIQQAAKLPGWNP
ncbi:MAG: DUF1801 domain-containing protein [Spirochaetota bacterium]